MHGQIAMTLNRKGRKRKSGRREPNGRAQRKPIDYRAMSALQPHRIGLPEAVRTHERGESELGRLSLLKRISESEYSAGRRYSVLVGAYLAMIGIGEGSGGRGPHECEYGDCDICRATTDRYMRAHEAISRAGGHKAHMAINRVVIDDRICDSEQLEQLRLGLSALARHFGLTNQRN